MTDIGLLLEKARERIAAMSATQSEHNAAREDISHVVRNMRHDDLVAAVISFISEAGDSSVAQLAQEIVFQIENHK